MVEKEEKALLLTKDLKNTFSKEASHTELLEEAKSSSIGRIIRDSQRIACRIAVLRASVHHYTAALLHITF